MEKAVSNENLARFLEKCDQRYVRATAESGSFYRHKVFLGFDDPSDGNLKSAIFEIISSKSDPLTKKDFFDWLISNGTFANHFTDYSASFDIGLFDPNNNSYPMLCCASNIGAEDPNLIDNYYPCVLVFVGSKFEYYVDENTYGFVLQNPNFGYVDIEVDISQEDYFSDSVYPL